MNGALLKKVRPSAIGKPVVALVALTIIVAGVAFFLDFKRRSHESAGSLLHSVAALKASELSLWRKERLGDPSLFQENPLLASLGSSSVDREARSVLASWLRRLNPVDGYDRLFVIFKNGGSSLAVPETRADDPELVRAASRTKTASFMDFYRNSSDGQIYLGVMAPLGTKGGAIALRIDPRLYVFPLLASWPTESASAEILLARAEGEGALVLNDTRFRSDAALSLRLPMKGSSPLTPKGVFFEGPDYRGIPVLSYTAPVPDSPWFLVVKMDLAEIDAPVREEGTILIVLVLALLGADFAGLGTMRIIRRNEAKGRESAETILGMIEILEQGRSDRAAEIAVSGSDLAASKDETAASNSDLRTSEGRLSASNDNLSDFSYSVAHDFRAPLRSIHGFSRIIKEEYAPVLDAEALRLLGLIQGSAKDMDDLIGDLLDISRFGRMEPERSLVDMNALAKTEVEGGLGSAEVRDFEITIGQLPAAWADPAMIARVWKNLISNAVKFSGPSPRHRIRISGRREGAMEVYSIEDAGVGFEERYADKLFGNFHRLHPPKDFPGRGIGLAIVKRIIGRHGGAVGAEGRPGKGATFWFSLPERS